MGRDGLVTAIIASLVMFAGAYFFGADPLRETGMGICFFSPGQWGLSQLESFLASLGLVAAISIALWLWNKKFGFVLGNDTVIIGMFLVMSASNVWLSRSLTTSEIMALGNILCMIILFGCYRRQNATQELFVIATVLAIGSMIQYAFLFMLPVYIIGAMILKCFSFKGFLAMLVGLVAPYWIGLGFGIISPDSFRMPTLTNFFYHYTTHGDFFIVLVNVAVTFLIALLLALNNMVKLYAGNTQRSKYNMVINLWGIVTVMCMLIDFNNLLVYVSSLYVVAAIQLGNLFALWDINRGPIWLIALSALYVAGFMLML